MIVRLHPDHPTWFPDPSTAEGQGPAAGLAAVGGDLEPERLLAAYAQGFFPWYDAGSPLLWWSPDPRCVLLPDRFHVPRSLRRQLNRESANPRFELRTDTAFTAVMQRCADMPRQGQGGTWILPEMVRAYTRLHELGFAHSAEAWALPESAEKAAEGSAENPEPAPDAAPQTASEKGEELHGHGAGQAERPHHADWELVAGVYGVALGRAFFAESMFHTRPYAAKIVLARLAQRLWEAGYLFIDCQLPTPHVLGYGASLLPRSAYLDLLREALAPCAL